MSRSDTLLVALLVINTLLGVVCLVVSQGERKSRALRLWGLGMLVYSLGILVTIPISINFDVRKVLGNTLIILAPVITIEGVVAHAGRRLSRPWTAALVTLSIVPIVVNHLRTPSVALVDIAVPSIIATLLFLYATWLMLRRPPAFAVTAARFLAFTLAVSVTVWVARVIAIWMMVGGTNDRDRADLTIALFAIAQIAAAVAATLGLLWMEVRSMQAELQRLADSDALTQLPNRRATLVRFENEVARAKRRRGSFAMMVFDIDHFKDFNDRHGHSVGDATLKHVADILNRGRRDEDLVGRLGGEEFVLLFGEQSEDGALSAANRLREQVAAAPLLLGGKSLTVTISGGLAVYPTDGETWDRLFSAADQRLYAAKDAGRNRVVGTAGSIALNAARGRVA